MKVTLLRSILSCAALLATNALAASDVTAKVHAINVNKTWGGIFIQLDTTPTFALRP